MGICGSDLHLYYAPPAPKSYQPPPHPLTAALSDGLGADVAFDAAGVGPAVLGGLGALTHLPEDFDEMLSAMSAGKFNTEGWVDLIGMDDTLHSMQEMHAGRGMKFMVNLEKLASEQ